MGMGMEMEKGGVDYGSGGEHENNVLVTAFEIMQQQLLLQCSEGDKGS